MYETSWSAGRAGGRWSLLRARRRRPGARLDQQLGAAHPVGTSAAALFFGLAEAIGMRSQLGVTKELPIQLVLMLPYVITIGAITLSSAWRMRRGLVATTAGELRD
jgi:hypothetical protein